MQLEPDMFTPEPEEPAGYIRRGRAALAKSVHQGTAGGDSIIAPRQLIVSDETGQPWAISVRSDGQLQTAKYPDGEPLTMQIWANRAIIDALEASAGSGLEVHGTDDT